MLALLTLLTGVALADAPAESTISSGDRRQGPFTRDAYPSEVSLRPLTLPAGMLRGAVTGGASYIRVGSLSWSPALGAAASFGLTDWLELSAFADAGLTPVVDRQRLGVSGALLLADGAAFDLALSVGLEALPYSGTLVPAVTLSLPGRVLITREVFLVFGADLLRVQVPTLQPQAALKLGLGAQVSGGVAIVLETDAVKPLFLPFTARRFALPLELIVTVAVLHGFDLRARAQVSDILDPRLAGLLTLSGSAYF